MQELLKYLLLIPLFLLGEQLSAQNQNLLKNFLTVEDGLSHNEVTSIVQDPDGFIWIGTRGGLNRYDGYEFKIFNQVPGDSNSLVNPSIESLFVDSKGNIWIGTKSGGVSKYNPVTGVFTNIVSNYKIKNEILPDNRILSFYEDKKGKIWMGTWNNGVIIYDEETNTSKQFLDGIINSIVESADGDIWVGAGSGLFEFKLEDYSYTHHGGTANCQEIVYDEKRNIIWIAGGQNIGLRKFNLLNKQIETFNIGSSFAKPEYARYVLESILIDKSDRIWVGTWGTGFYQFDQDNEKFVRHTVHPENVATLNKDYDAVLDIFQDKTGNIWLGTNGGGVVVLTEKLGFKSVGYHSQPSKGLLNTRIMSVVDDRNGNLWLGTIGGGLFWSPDKENFYSVPNNDFNDKRFFIIKYLYEADDGTIWVGTNNKTFIIEFENGNPKLIDAVDKFGASQLIRQVVSVAEKDNLLLFGLLQGGLILVDKSDGYKFIKRLTKANSKNGTQKSNRISYLLRDSKERIWVGTYNGLHVFNVKDTSIVLAEEQYDISGEFTGNIITCLDEDPMGNIWIGTPNGLNKLSELDDNKFTVEYYTEEDGLASNFIKGIAHDLNGNIWLSTNVGISRLEAKDGNHVVNFDEKDGVNGENFSEASVFRNEKGEIFFGGTHGLTRFHPDDIVEETKLPKPMFTSLSILNKIINPEQNSDNNILIKSIAHTNQIELSHRQNKIEVQFSALDFKSAGRNHYKIYLENYDKDWNTIGLRRFAIFNNLKPGEYLLHVKCSNRHKIWNEEAATLRIVIEPPIWQTWYALLFYILVVVGIVTVIRLNAIKQVRLANSLEMEKLQHQQDLKINELKLRFFTNLSHEFRTPLTLILAPLKELLGKREDYQLSNEAQNKIGIVQNNSLRLMNLVNQLLDFRKVESGNMRLAASNTNLEEFIAEICHPFIELARINNISFKLNTSLKTKNIWVDRDKLEIILNNLISNSFKNIRADGKIEVALYEEEDVVLLCISDNGLGIPKVDIDNIFERFYRVGQSTGHGSSGIGLALVKRYTELHKASISVVSEVNKRTEFTLSLLKGSNHLAPEEMVELEHSEKEFVHKEQFFNSVLPIKEKPIAKSDDCILIVEDNPEVNAYLVSVLEPLYSVYSAHDGLEGYDLALDKIPNLIISDVMMPKMDGFEFCKKIHENTATGTIPFIFLTAKSDEQFKLLGTQLGADDFLSKPFDPNLLLEKVKNILESRKKLQKQYSKSVRLGPSEIEITSGEEIFIEKVILTIEENLQNDKFSSDVLASEMNMSNSSLYRKLKGLTGSSTAEFIRSIRIKRAAQLLVDKERTITEIAYEVGFNDVKHFRTVFQKQFACTPSEYRAKL